MAEKHPEIPKFKPSKEVMQIMPLEKIFAIMLSPNNVEGDYNYSRIFGGLKNILDTAKEIEGEYNDSLVFSGLKDILDTAKKIGLKIELNKLSPLAQNAIDQHRKKTKEKGYVNKMLKSAQELNLNVH